MGFLRTALLRYEPDKVSLSWSLPAKFTVTWQEVNLELEDNSEGQSWRHIGSQVCMLKNGQSLEPRFFFFLFSSNLLLYFASTLQILGILPLPFHHITHLVLLYYYKKGNVLVTVADFGLSTVKLNLRVWLTFILEVSKLHNVPVLLFSVMPWNAKHCTMIRIIIQCIRKCKREHNDTT